MSILITNLVRTVLSDVAGVDAADTTINVTVLSGELPTLGDDDYFRMVLIRASDQAKEFIKVTAVTGAGPYALTVDRAEEDSTALDLDQGDAAEIRLTAQTFEDYRAEIQAIADSANASAATAVASSENANSVAAAALSASEDILPIDDTKLSDNAVKPASLHTDVAGDGIGGGGGEALYLKLLETYLELDGNGELTVKSGSLLPALFSGGTPMKSIELEAGDETDSRIYKGTAGATKIFGPVSDGKLSMIFLSLKNLGTDDTKTAYGNIRIGTSLNYYATGTGDSGVAVQTFSIPSGVNAILPISFILPNNFYYCIEITSTDDSTNTVVFHSHRILPFN